MISIEVLTAISEEQPPRSETTVEGVAGDSARRTRRLARLLRVSFLILAAGPVLMFAVTALTDSKPVDWSFVRNGRLILVLAETVLPAWALWKWLIPDADAAIELGRLGAAHRGRVVGDLRTVTRIRVLKVAWIEDGRERTARVVLAEWIGPLDQNVITVLVRPNLKRVGVILGKQGMFISVRKLLGQ